MSNQYLDTKMLNLTPNERKFIKYYRLLDEEGKATVDNLVKQERNRCVKEFEDIVSPKIKKSPPKKWG